MTNQLTRLLITVAIAVAGIGAAASIPNSQKQKETVITLTEPVEIPGMILSAGTYVLRLGSEESGRQVLQIFAKDSNDLVATYFADIESEQEAVEPEPPEEDSQEDFEALQVVVIPPPDENADDATDSTVCDGAAIDDGEECDEDIDPDIEAGAPEEALYIARAAFLSLP